MSSEELNQLVQEISLAEFAKPFLHEASFNRRLRTTGGRYLLKTGNIEINYRVYELYGRSELISIIKHELCHYHLHQQGEEHLHRDKSFKELLTAVGGARYVRPLATEQESAYRYHLRCRKCGQNYYRKRKLNVRKHRCGKCLGKLDLLFSDIKTIDK
jgi:SprT-like protein